MSLTWTEIVWLEAATWPQLSSFISQTRFSSLISGHTVFLTIGWFLASYLTTTSGACTIKLNRFLFYGKLDLYGEKLRNHFLCSHFSVKIKEFSFPLSLSFSFYFFEIVWKSKQKVGKWLIEKECCWNRIKFYSINPKWKMQIYKSDLHQQIWAKIVHQ